MFIFKPWCCKKIDYLVPRYIDHFLYLLSESVIEAKASRRCMLKLWKSMQTTAV